LENQVESLLVHDRMSYSSAPLDFQHNDFHQEKYVEEYEILSLLEHWSLKIIVKFYI
jgi:hypothetical protein